MSKIIINLSEYQNRIKMVLSFLCILLLCPFFGIGQSIVDQDAKRLLDKVSENFDKHKKLEVNFDLVVKLPEMENEVQKGHLLQDGDKYRVTIASQEILNNGNDIYIILKDQNIAQLNSVNSNDSEQALLNPRELIKLYKSGDYEYAIVGEDDFKGERVVLIEFKPKDRFAEYSKLRIALNKETELPTYFKIFNKDGSQYTLDLYKFNFSPNITQASFEFNKSDYPGIRVEDLRID